MLINHPSVTRSSPILLIVAMASGSGPTKNPSTGVYYIGHFGSSDFLPEFDDYPEIEGFAPFGVCDGHEQLLEAIPMLESHPERKFVICLHEIRKSAEPDDGGWRWHKWGPYIGKQTPTTEYLHDEPVIERVCTYHIYELKDGDVPPEVLP